MSIEENKALDGRIYEEIWNNKNLGAIDEIYSADVITNNLPPEMPTGIEGLKQFVAMYLTAFPNPHFHVDDQVGEGDKVVTRWTFHGKHEGELMGIPATGKDVTVTGIGVSRIAGGKIVEEWGEFDTMGMMVQLGVVSPPGG